MAPKRMTLGHPKVERLLTALKAGHYVDEACSYAPISEQTYYRWLREGDNIQRKAEQGTALTDEEQAIRELCEAIKKAEVSGQNAALDVIREAIKGGTWQAAAWFMERRNKKWSNRTQITGDDGGPIEVAAVSREELTNRMLAIIESLDDEEWEDEDTY